MRCTWCQKSMIHNLSMKEILFPLTVRNNRCSFCQARLQKIPLDQACPTCCKIGGNKQCQDCLRWQRIFPDYSFSHHAFFVYDEAFQEWIHQYKFLGDYRLRQTFVPEIRNYLKRQRADFICPIPLSEERLASRGFNQTEAFLSAANIPWVSLLKKEQDTTPQAQKKRHERLATKQPFQATIAIEQIRGQKVILVDDVYTTGRTLFHAAILLKAHGAKEICTVSLAR
ncbi:ComF family protein [Enterococcus sp. LJL98]